MPQLLKWIIKQHRQELRAAPQQQRDCCLASRAGIPSPKQPPAAPDKNPPDRREQPSAAQFSPRYSHIRAESNISRPAEEPPALSGSASAMAPRSVLPPSAAP